MRQTHMRIPYRVGMGIGRALEDLRVSAGFDQKTLAAKTKIPQPDISHYEKETRSPTIERVLMIEKACGANPGTAFVTAGFVEDIDPVERAVMADGVLSPSDKDVLLGLYETLLQSPRARAAGRHR